jgi:hypothetical protein
MGGRIDLTARNRNGLVSGLDQTRPEIGLRRSSPSGVGHCGTFQAKSAIDCAPAIVGAAASSATSPEQRGWALAILSPGEGGSSLAADFTGRKPLTPCHWLAVPSASWLPAVHRIGEWALFLDRREWDRTSMSQIGQ